MREEKLEIEPAAPTADASELQVRVQPAMSATRNPIPSDHARTTFGNAPPQLNVFLGNKSSSAGVSFLCRQYIDHSTPHGPSLYPVVGFSMERALYPSLEQLT